MTERDWEKLAAQHDPSQVWATLVDYPQMFEEAAKFSAPRLPAAPLIVVSGMGGSAMAAELYRDAVGDDSGFEIYLNRRYSLPGWLPAGTPVILSSYTGETEETLAAYEEAKKRGFPMGVVASGGRLSELAMSDGIATVTVPGGLHPRYSIPYMFGALEALLPHPKFELAQVSRFLLKLQQDASGENPAVEIAEAAHKNLLSLYVDQGWAGVAKVWQAQFYENAKCLLEVGLFSEANHNEILTWSNGEIPRAGLILETALDPERIHKRFELVKPIWREQTGTELVHQTIQSDDRLLVVWDAVYRGLWASYYLGLLRGINPAEDGLLGQLKGQLKQT